MTAAGAGVEPSGASNAFPVLASREVKLSRLEQRLLLAAQDEAGPVR